MRPFEVLATGALLMLDLHEELSPELVHENNLILFNSIDDFKTLLTKLLNNPSEIERIADNGQKFIENRYSYNEMAKTILSKFFEINHLLS
jgi:spore maturation protein CgeB